MSPGISGAGAVARGIAARLSAPLVLQVYSRLVIDCNRPTDVPDSVPETIHGIDVPGNQTLSEAARQARIDEIFKPFHNAVSSILDGRPRRAVLAIHSFNPELSGIVRPWDIGFQFRKHSRHVRAAGARAGGSARRVEYRAQKALQHL